MPRRNYRYKYRQICPLVFTTGLICDCPRARLQSW